MKNKNLFVLPLLVSLLFVVSCNFLGVDENEVVLGEYNPVSKITGTVYTAGGDVLPGATVSINGMSVVSNMDGEYTLSFDQFPASGSNLNIEADGFIPSNQLIQYQGDAPFIYTASFSLTRALPAGFVNLNAGGELIFEDVRVVIPGNNSASYQGNTIQDVQLSVTPLSPISTYGSFNGSSIKTLVFSPAGIEFDQEITVYITIPQGFNHEGISLSTFDANSNSWSNVNAGIEFNAATNEISFKQTIVLSNVRLNTASLEITSDDLSVIESSVTIRFEPSTCDCSVPGSLNFGSFLAQFTLENTNPSGINPPDFYELRDLHFFGQIGVGGLSQTVLDNYIAGLPYYNIIQNFPIGTCESYTVDVQRVYREIVGTYTFNGIEKSFKFRYFYGVTSPDVSALIDCTTGSPCHQGCPVI